MLLRIHICGHDKSVPYSCERIAIMLLTVCNNVANTNEMGCEHSVRRRGPIHRARIITLSNTYIHVIKYVFPFHRTHISTSPHAHIRLPFCGCFHIRGHDKSDPYGCERSAKTLRTDCDNPTNTHEMSNEHSVKYQRSPTKWGANTPLGVGTDSSCPYPNINKHAYFHNQICVFTLLNTHIHFTKYVFPHY